MTNGTSLSWNSRGVLLSSLRRMVEGVGKGYRQARYLGSVARNRWFTDMENTFDQVSRARPWDYASQLEQERYARVIARVTDVRGNNWERALELGAHHGDFTEALANRCGEVLACDISSAACDQIRSRFAELAHVHVQKLNLETDPLPGIFDCAFVMDILNYIYGRDKMLRISSKLAAALRPGGTLVITDCRLAPYIRESWFRYLVPIGGDNIADLFASRPEWSLLSREFHPHSGTDRPDYMAHVIALFERKET
jgi:SAM-dependent methyltransferase